MDEGITNLIPTKLVDGIHSSFRHFLFQILAFGPMPRHVAFIPDGNRRYGRKLSLEEGESHRIGFLKLISIIKYCYEMSIKYISFYGFSIDNFNRKKTEVQILMNLIQNKSEALIKNQTIIDELGVRIKFLGNLGLLDEDTRKSVKQVMEATACNSKIVLLIFLAYTSTDEIVHGVNEACKKVKEVSISVEELERNVYLTGHPDPDILIRTSGETRLSNFLLWQTSCCLLYAPKCLWPEISLRHLVWGIILYQRNQKYFEKIKRKL